MKEKEFLDYISNIKADSATDQRILTQVLNYEESKQKKVRFSFMHAMTRAAAVLLIVSALGTATVLAAGFFVKSYSARLASEKDFDMDESITGIPVNKTTIMGSQRITDENGYTVGLERIQGADSEAFALLNLPNLVPSYLQDHYYTDSDGYVYLEETLGDSVTKRMKAFYISDTLYTKEVYLWFDLLPTNQSAKDTPILMDESNEITTYVTKNGLICTICKNQEVNSFLNVLILYDSETLGNALYRLEFSPNIEMDEVITILESIPFTAN